MPAVPDPDDRPLALIDEANISGFGEPSSIKDWVWGATKAWALGLALDVAGWRPVFIPDPLNRQKFRAHLPSARAIELVVRNPRWSRPMARDWGAASGKNNADRSALTILRRELESGQRAILISDDRFRDSDDDSLTAEFPELLDDRFYGRIYRPALSGNVISVSELELSAPIPVELFQPGVR